MGILVEHVLPVLGDAIRETRRAHHRQLDSPLQPPQYLGGTTCSLLSGASIVQTHQRSWELCVRSPPEFCVPEGL